MDVRFARLLAPIAVLISYRCEKATCETERPAVRPRLSAANLAASMLARMTGEPAPGTVEAPAPATARKGLLATGIELVLTVGIAIGLALLLQAFLVKPYKIPSGSMKPTLQIGQRILVNRLDTSPSLGDVVVFHPPADALGAVCGNPGQGENHAQACDQHGAAESSQTFVKRVVGLPGDHLRILDGHVWRNGVEEHGSYVQTCDDGPGNCDFPQTIVVPKGDYYMMGDNRGDSDDSRYWGPIPQKWIIGTAFATYWPIDRIGFF
jgi:signal peptidase I